jgi:hypothetical protein
MDQRGGAADAQPGFLAWDRRQGMAMLSRRQISVIVLVAFFLIVAPIAIGFALLQLATHDVEQQISLHEIPIGVKGPKTYFRYWKFRFTSRSLVEIDFDYTDQVDAANAPDFLDPHDDTAKVTWGLFGPWRHANLVLK